MESWVEVFMEDPDFVMAHAEEGFYHFNMALYDGPRSPSEAMRATEELARKENITRSAAALSLSKQIENSTSHKTGEWQLAS